MLDELHGHVDEVDEVSKAREAQQVPELAAGAALREPFDHHGRPPLVAHHRNAVRRDASSDSTQRAAERVKKGQKGTDVKPSSSSSSIASTNSAASKPHRPQMSTEPGHRTPRP